MASNRPVFAPSRQQQLITAVAARLIAESGFTDYEGAKRKAAQSLGLPDSVQLPENAAIEAELRTFQRVFQNDEQTTRIRHLRQKAGELMVILQQFNPYLTGSVLDGSATRYAEIDIQLFTDSAKDVEIFLLNRQIAFTHSTPRTDRAEAVLSIDGEEATANLIVYPSKLERTQFKNRNGRTRPRAKIEAVNRLLQEVCETEYPYNR